MSNILDDLDIDLDTDAQTAVAEPVETAEQNDEHAAQETPGKIVIKKAKGLPPTSRAGRGGGRSAYPFADLEAPTADGELAYFSIEVSADADEAEQNRVKRSVQSAATNQNRRAKTAGTNEYFETRVTRKGGRIVSIEVYRTDNRRDESASEE